MARALNNYIVPTRPDGDSTNAAASTEFVTRQIEIALAEFGGGGSGTISIDSTPVTSGIPGEYLKVDPPEGAPVVGQGPLVLDGGIWDANSINTPAPVIPLVLDGGTWG